MLSSIVSGRPTESVWTKGEYVSHTLFHQARIHCILTDQNTKNLSLPTSFTLMHNQSHLATISKCRLAGFLTRSPDCCSPTDSWLTLPLHNRALKLSDMLSNQPCRCKTNSVSYYQFTQREREGTAGCHGLVLQKVTGVCVCVLAGRAVIMRDG